MLYNRDYAMLLKTGRGVPKETFRGYYKSSFVVIGSIIGILGIIGIAILIVK